MPCRDHNSCLRCGRALGIYGVISYSVTRQTQEIGIRMALRDTPATVQRSVLARTPKLALIGVVLGAVASHAASQIIASLLFQTDPADHLTFISVLLLTVALAAGYFPAQRATRIAVALRPK
jgi:ABC-type antimicrobial peptide transport system permease subunit